MVKKKPPAPKYVPQVPIGMGITEIGKTVRGGGLLAKKPFKKK